MTSDKYSSRECEILYERSLEGAMEEQCGDVDGYGWFCYMKDTGIKGYEFVILSCDIQGFVNHITFTNLDDLTKYWETIKNKVEEFENGII